MKRLIWITLLVSITIVCILSVAMIVFQRSGAAADDHAPPLAVADAPAAPGDPLIFSYAAKFVCTEALQPGAYSTNLITPIVQQKTDILVHNPNDYPITFYKKAVRAVLEGVIPPTPGNWNSVLLQPDRAMHINCDEVAKLLTNNPNATFIGTYGIGVTVEGFVVMGVGPQTVPGRGNIPYAYLDVQADYLRSSEVLKKDISYQPWWIWWWWNLPWRLGYAYNRLVLVNPNGNIDCRGSLYDALAVDASTIGNVNQRNATLAALQNGRSLDPANPGGLHADAPPAIVALIGGCDKIIGPGAGQVSADISYVLLSNKGYSDPDPITGIPPVQVAATYPWVPGKYYDLPVVMPQNVSTDLDGFMRQWHIQRWIDAGAGSSAVQSAMVYYFPYWCGWGRWWWWWNGGDCEDIGVGEGESLDVEQITPVRIFMAQWPPVNQ